jgi:uncharacterized protein with von Willebrand factor type A (vWA) domain
MSDTSGGGQTPSGPRTGSATIDGRRGSDPLRPKASMLDLLNGFVQELRNAGLPVSLTENLDAMEAVQHIPIEDRDAFKYALGATLIKNNSHWRAFETVFEVYFSLRGPEYRLADADESALDELWREMQEQQASRGRAPRVAGRWTPSRPKRSPRCSCRRCSTATRR